MSGSQHQWNSRLGLGIAIVGALVTLAYWILLYAKPDWVLPRIQTIEMKAIMAGLVPALVASIGALVYSTFHSPSVRIFIRRGANFLTGLSTAASGFAVFGWPRLEQLTFNETDGLNLGFKPSETAGDVAQVIWACTVAIVLSWVLYTLAAFLEKKFDIT